MDGLDDFLERRLRTPIKALLVQGLSPDRLALTLAVGLVIAAFPVIGATTILSVVAALALRLNMPLIQTVNYLGAPLQLACIIPFIRLGEWLFGAETLRLTLNQIVTLATTDPGRAVTTLWTSTWHAIAAWVIVAPLAAAAVFVVLRPALRAAGRQFRPSPAPVSPRVAEDAGGTCAP